MLIAKGCQQLFALGAALFLRAQLLVTLQAFGMELPMPLGREDTSATPAIILAARRRLFSIHQITFVSGLSPEGGAAAKASICNAAWYTITLLYVIGKLCDTLPSTKKLSACAIDAQAGRLCRAARQRR